MKRMMVFIVVAALWAGVAQAVPITFQIEGILDAGDADTHGLSHWAADGTWGGTVTFNLEYYHDEYYEAYCLEYVSSDLEIYSAVTHEWGGDEGDPENYPLYEYWGIIGGEEISFALHNDVCWYPGFLEEWDMLENEIEFAVTFALPGDGLYFGTEVNLVPNSELNNSAEISEPADLYAGTGVWTGSVMCDYEYGYSALGSYVGTQYTVPEPATIALAGMALAGFMVGARCRR